MKHIIAISVLLFFSCNTHYPEKKSEIETSEVTTYYFIRHAEKDRSNPTENNPHLLDEGRNRAENWKSILENVEFDAVYATDFHRTQETAKPTAEKNGLNITIYDPNTLKNIDNFLKDTKGKTVLVVGHSNTTPAFVNAVLKKRKYDDIDDRNNGNLYIVTIVGNKVFDQLLIID